MSGARAESRWCAECSSGRLLRSHAVLTPPESAGDVRWRIRTRGVSPARELNGRAWAPKRNQYVLHLSTRRRFRWRKHASFRTRLWLECGRGPNRLCQTAGNRKINAVPPPSERSLYEGTRDLEIFVSHIVFSLTRMLIKNHFQSDESPGCRGVPVGPQTFSRFAPRLDFSVEKLFRREKRSQNERVKRNERATTPIRT